MSQGQRLSIKGGPLDGQEAFFTSRKGIILLDRHTRTLWIYDWDKSANLLVARDPEGALFDSEKREKARMDGNYELLSISSQPSLERLSPPGEEMQV